MALLSQGNLRRVKRLVSDSAVYGGTDMVRRSLAFLLIPVLTRYFTPTEYGLAATFTAVLGVMHSLVPLGSSGAVAREFYEGEGGKPKPSFPRYVGNAVFVMLTSGAVVFAGLALIGPLAEPLLQIPRSWYLITPVVALAAGLSKIKLGLWRVRRKPWPFGISQIGLTATDLTLTLLMVVAIGLDWRGRAGGVAGAYCLFAVLHVGLLFRNRDIEFGIDWDQFRDVVSFGGPLVFHALGFWVIAMADRLMLNAMAGVDETGIYAVAYAFGMALEFAHSAFNMAWGPFMYEELSAEEDPEKRDLQLVRLSYGVMACSLTLAALVAVVGPWALRFVAGSAYHEGARFIPWVAFGYSFHGLYKVISAYLFYSKKTQFIAGATLAAAAVNVLANLWLIPREGAMGAAKATMIAYAFHFFAVWGLGQRVQPMPWLRALLPARSAGR